MSQISEREGSNHDMPDVLLGGVALTALRLTSRYGAPAADDTRYKTEIERTELIKSFMLN